MKVVKKVIYVAVALFCLNLTVSAQSITLKVSNITVKQAMDELKSRSGYSFVFSSAGCGYREENIRICGESIGQCGNRTYLAWPRADV